MWSKDRKMDTINIDPSIWGSSLWNTMEALACTLNHRNRMDIKKFFDILRCVLPCENCRNHYNQYYNEYPISDYMETPLTLLLWIYKLKSMIKVRQQKKIDVDFLTFIDNLIEKYDVPELQYYIDKNEEFKRMLKILNIKESKFLKKYKLLEFDEMRESIKK